MHNFTYYRISMKRLVILSLIILVFISCQKDNSKAGIYFKLPKKLKELSGLSSPPSSKMIWSIEDSGNKNVLYGLDSNGTLSKEITVSNVPNKDWEDLTADTDGNLYVGDF